MLWRGEKRAASEASVIEISDEEKEGKEVPTSALPKHKVKPRISTIRVENPDTAKLVEAVQGLSTAGTGEEISILLMKEILRRLDTVEKRLDGIESRLNEIELQLVQY